MDKKKLEVLSSPIYETIPVLKKVIKYLEKRILGLSYHLKFFDIEKNVLKKGKGIDILMSIIGQIQIIKL